MAKEVYKEKGAGESSYQGGVQIAEARDKGKQHARRNSSAALDWSTDASRSHAQQQLTRDIYISACPEWTVCLSVHACAQESRWIKESCICNIQSRSPKIKHVVRTQGRCIEGRAGIEAGKGDNNMVMMLAIIHASPEQYIGLGL